MSAQNRITPLAEAWMPTRTTLQAYARALTAFPRAAGTADTRWSHVSMDPVDEGFATAPVVLADGAELSSTLDIANHRIIVSAGSDLLAFDMGEGPSPRSLGDAVVDLAHRHGTTIDVDRARFSDRGKMDYAPGEAASFRESARSVVAAMAEVNADLEGEVTGPHLWPHGFDIATEWYVPRIVEHDGERGNAQIAVGWYPSDSSYLYANPWPFESSWSGATLPHGASWHLDGWQGAELAVPSEGLDGSVLVELARAVHELAGLTLEG